MTEQRHYQRISFVTTNEVEIDAVRYDATLADISLKGALVVLPAAAQPEEGKPCRLRIELGSSETVLSFEGEIAHVHGELAGIRFTRYNLETITHLRRLLELNSSDPDRVLSELFALATGR
jgi:hypothetical protein